MLDLVSTTINQAVAPERWASPPCDEAVGDTRPAPLRTEPGDTRPYPSRSPERRGVEVVSRNGSIYLLEGLLGRGGLGEVHAARRRSDGLAVAIKLPLAGASDLEMATLKNESRMLEKLNHPHIVDVLEYGETVDGIPYMTMPIIEGRTLSSLIKECGPLSRSRAAGICAQIADAISYAHALGLVHRDIKPANIMVSEVGGFDWVYVLDFGISGAVDARGRQSQSSTSGSLCYMAPEQILNHPYTTRSDVYQLALVLYECVAGRLPFMCSIGQAVLYRLSGEVLGEDVSARLSFLGDDFLAVVAKGLAREPESRFTSMMEFARALSRWTPVLAEVA